MSKSVSDKELCLYLLGLFVTLAPYILAPKPPPGSNTRDIIVNLHYESKEALTVATRNKSCIDFKHASSLSLWRKGAASALLTTHLQNHQVPYPWWFPFNLSASKDGVQSLLRDIYEVKH